MNEEFEKLWEQIEENFDWNRVYQVMKLLDWAWSIKGEMAIPIPETIKAHARASAWKSFEDKLQHSSGGIRTYCDSDGLGVTFELTDWFADAE